jgi:PPOX class probable F420-dependent enzyme
VRAPASETFVAELSEAAIRQRLDDWPVARLATIAPDGRPHQVPIVFARAGAALWSPIDGKAKSGEELARVRNVRAHPEVSLLLDAYDEDWTRLWWIRLDATARVVQPSGHGPAPAQVGQATAPGDAAFEEALGALRSKYPQYRTVPLLQGRPTLLAFTWSHVRSWNAA